MSRIDTRNIDALSGAIFFTVGRGTEGGSASYRLSVAGVATNEWGKVGEVVANSGYTMGAIQVDFGQRGTWPVGAIEDRPLRPGEKSYVDAVIAQASSYAGRNHLPFTDNLRELRSDLLTHGNGKKGRQSIDFIDTGTRDSINAWASSIEGKRWIHANIDYPQVRNATQHAMSVVNLYGSHIPEDQRFPAISILAKTANQAPALLERMEKVLKDGGDYDDLLAKAKEIKANPKHTYYDGPKAAAVAERYAAAYNDPSKTHALDRANAMVSSPSYDPSVGESDPSIRVALAAIGQRAKTRAVANSTIEGIQRNLNELGITDARGLPLDVDGNRGGPTSHTNEAIASFKRTFGLEDSQMSESALLAATQVALTANPLRNLNQAMRNALPQTIHEDKIAHTVANGLPDYLLVKQASSPEDSKRHLSASVSTQARGAHTTEQASADHAWPAHASPSSNPRASQQLVAPPAPDDLVGQYFAMHGGNQRIGANSGATAPTRELHSPATAHPNDAMLQQIRTGVRAEAERQGWNNDRTVERVSHSLLAECLVTGIMKRVDHVAVGPTGNIFAVQGKLDDPARTWTCVSLDVAARTPVEQSGEKVASAAGALIPAQAADAMAPEARAPQMVR